MSGSGTPCCSAATTPSAGPRFGGIELASVEVLTGSGPGGRIGVDPERGALLIEGDRPGLGALAGELRSTASMDDGGHQHMEYHPDHPYLAAESLPLVVNSPHGGMPSR
ncbi:MULTISPECIES: hypothetical protein [unclassified Streptomyces]|uniref:Imm32 family immunity protein n=1 Tax=unclassified Streptomyces TaxID=2593676 RepID=UPI0013A6A17A|nr:MULTISPECIES: hypothetical protein [unclassified Streptomyces]